MTKMVWCNELPKEEGTYIVETVSMMGNLRRIEAFWNGKRWNFSNQLFKKYLKNEK